MNQVGGPVISTTRATGAERQRIIRGWRNDEYVRLAPGHYIESGQAGDLTREERIRARIVAYACTAPRSAVVGISAAHLWGFPVADSHRALEQQGIELASFVARTRRSGVVRHRRLGRRSHAGSVHSHETDFGTVLVTDALTTALDLSRWATLDDSVRALDYGLAHELFTREEVEQRVVTLGGVKGIADVQLAFQLASAGSESPRETDVKLLLWRMGMPVPWQQAEIRSRRGVWLGRVDFFYPDLGLIIEYDGAGKYLVDPGDPHSTKAREYDQNEQYRINGLVPVHINDATLRNGIAEELIRDYIASLSVLATPYPDHCWSAGHLAWTTPEG